MLGGRMRTQVIIGGQIIDRLQHGGIIRQNGPAKTPTGHAEELGETVAHDGARVTSQHRFDLSAVRLMIGQIKIGLVHDAPCATLGGQLAYFIQHGEVDGGAGGIGRRGDHHGLGVVRPILAA